VNSGKKFQWYRLGNLADPCQGVSRPTPAIASSTAVGTKEPAMKSPPRFRLALAVGLALALRGWSAGMAQEPNYPPVPSAAWPAPRQIVPTRFPAAPAQSAPNPAAPQVQRTPTAYPQVARPIYAPQAQPLLAMRPVAATRATGAAPSLQPLPQVATVPAAPLPVPLPPYSGAHPGAWQHTDARLATYPTAHGYQDETPMLDPDQPGNLGQDLGPGGVNDMGVQNSPVLDPNQAGNLDIRMDALERKLHADGEPTKDDLPLIRLSGFMQLDMGLHGQSDRSAAQIGDLRDGIGFRRTRLQAIGKLTEFTGYSIEMDFATVGRPSFMDVWGEQEELPFFGTLRIGHFRQPIMMDSLTSIRHLDFMERALPFQAFDPFRRVGIMSYAASEDERMTWAYSVYGTGLTFFNGIDTTYSTLGDSRAGTQIGDSGGISFASRLTRLLYYDDLAQGRYLVHVGGGYNFSQIGGEGTTGAFAKTYNARPFPEFFVGDLAGFGIASAGTPAVVDTGRILADNLNLYHLELAGNAGPAHFQTEVVCVGLNQMNGPTIWYPGAYFQCGYFLTGESCLYLKQAGVLDYNVVPYSDFFGVGRRKWCIGGWGAWEVAFRWSWIDLDQDNLLPGNQLSAVPGPPPAPNPGTVNESTLALNWWWNRFTRLQLNWIHSMPNYPGVGTAPFDIVGGRFQIEF
jgi:phosphate-selective porin OprO/OprP